MATWSIPIQAGWKLRVLSGTSIGQEFDLRPGRYVLGSRAGADIVIPSPAIAPRHVTIEVRSDHVQVDDCSGGLGMHVNGVRTASARLAPGEPVTVGGFSFEFRNPAVRPAPGPTAPGPLAGLAAPLARLAALPLYQRVGLITLSVAAAMFLLLATTHIPTLVPVTLLAMSAVVPATAMCYLIEKYDKTGITFYTFAITFLAGGTVGIISTVIGAEVAGLLTGGLLLAPIFAGVAEEPAKLLATAWRWRHPSYDRPMDGLLIGTVSGFGFAVFESAGYGFTQLATGGNLGDLLGLMLLRGATSPFGHGLWSGIVAAAFWQCGRDLRRAMHSRAFGIAGLWAVGLHGLWNASVVLPGFGWGCTLLSAILSVREYRRLLARKGYRS
jgi:RsiW-degrading membrane proteinase PrsW (M82 family)